MPGNPNICSEAVDVLVVGSANMDLTLRVDSLPAAGETVLGTRRQPRPGGKGANQAVAAAAAGARVALLGSVGADAEGTALRTALDRAGVGTGLVRTSQAESTGLAVILVDPAGDNVIAVAPGANHALRPADIDARAEQVRSCRVVLIQLEIPMDVVARAVALAADAEGGPTVVLNLSPTTAVAPEVLEGVDVLVVNRAEAEHLLGRPLPDIAAALAAAPALRDLGPPAVVVTAGPWGAIYCDGGPAVHRPAPEVPVVDTTGAGDAFAGALAGALSRDRPLPAAVDAGLQAGAAAVQRHGAQSDVS